MSKALFLDRDGTLILDKHYLADPAGVELIPGVADALRRARALGYRLFVLTNQSGISRGLYTLDDVHRCNVRMEELLDLPRPVFDDICVAPEGPNDPQLYRKPSPRYVVETVARLQLEPRHCWMIGDRESDITTGRRANIRVAAVCTGKHTAADWAQLALPDLPVFASLLEFVATLDQSDRSQPSRSFARPCLNLPKSNSSAVAGTKRRWGSGSNGCTPTTRSGCCVT